MQNQELMGLSVYKNNALDCEIKRTNQQKENNIKNILGENQARTNNEIARRETY